MRSAAEAAGGISVGGASSVGTAPPRNTTGSHAEMPTPAAWPLSRHAGTRPPELAPAKSTTMIVPATQSETVTVATARVAVNWTT